MGLHYACQAEARPTTATLKPDLQWFSGCHIIMGFALLMIEKVRISSICCIWRCQRGCYLSYDHVVTGLFLSLYFCLWFG